MSKILSSNAQQIGESRYFMEGEDWDKCSLRVASEVASIESDKSYKDKFYEMVSNMDFIPAGRILRNAGKIKGSLFNCFCLPIEDNIESIGQFIKESLIIWSEGGGVGSNWSYLRPKGDLILKKGGSSSGMVSFLEAADAVAKTIETGGQRRAAGLACVSIHHPEVLDFIDAKTEQGKISHFNISVIINDEFLTAVSSDSPWTFRFKQKEYNTVPARFIWDKIISNMIKYAEPGIINWSNFSKNNSYYYDPVVSPNPCMEATLSPYECCNLGSLVLPNFITGNVNTNWNKLDKIIKLAVRFLDNIIDINKYTLKEIDEKAHNSRRIGIGIMGLAEYLFSKELRYGSPKSILEIEKLMRFIRESVYIASVELSMERGSFPKFDSVNYGNASFIRKLPAKLRMDIKNHGVRNVTLMALAPTGTISLLPEVSSGIEPLPAKAYRRLDKVGERVYIHPKFKEMLSNSSNIPEWFVDAGDLKPEEHLEVQSIIQKYTDGSISKTINMPKGSTCNQLDKLLLEYIHDLKGVAVYIDGSRENQVLNRMDKEETLKYLKTKKSFVDTLIDEDLACPLEGCSKS